MISDGTEKSVLLRLHDQLDEACVEMTAHEDSSCLMPSVDPLEVEFALSKLVQSGLALSVGKNPTRYRLSRAGIAEVELGFKIISTINPSTGILHRSYSEISSNTLELPNTFNWGKWGAIAGLVAVPLTIVGIAIAIWLDFN